MPRYTLAVRTINRNLRGRQNYLGQTLANLERAGIMESTIPWSMAIVDGGSDAGFVPRELKQTERLLHCPRVRIVRAPRFLTPNENAVATWRAGSGTEWTIFLEDDIDFCARFLESVDAWLTQYASDSCRVYPLGAPYDQVRSARNFWRYPVEAFYAQQAVAVRSSDAGSIANFIEAHPGYLQGGDILIQKWSREEYPLIDYFLTPAPGLVQHVGQESWLVEGRNGKAPFFEFPSWLGRERSWPK